MLAAARLGGARARRHDRAALPAQVAAAPRGTRTPPSRGCRAACAPLVGGRLVEARPARPAAGHERQRVEHARAFSCARSTTAAAAAASPSSASKPNTPSPARVGILERAPLRRRAGRSRPRALPFEQQLHHRAAEGAGAARHDRRRAVRSLAGPPSSSHERPGSALRLAGSPFGPQPGSIGERRRSPTAEARFREAGLLQERYGLLASGPALRQPTTSRASFGKRRSTTGRKSPFGLAARRRPCA